MHSQTTRKFLEIGRAQLKPTLAERDRAPAFPKHLWEAAREAGLFHMMVPKELGGTGEGIRTFVEAIYGLSAGSLDAALISSFGAHGGIALDLMVQFGSKAQKAQYIPEMLGLKKIGTICNSEETGGTNLRGIKSVFKPDSQGSPMGTLEVKKGFATNASVADIIFTSAWCQESQEEKPSMEVFLVEGHEAEKQDLAPELSGFRTGSTGMIEVKSCRITRAERQLGPNRSGFTVFKRCFDFERLLIPTCIAGVISGILEDGMAGLAEREAKGNGLASNQYVQEKIVQMYAAREKLLGLIERVLAQAADGRFDRADLLLGVLKMTAIEEGLASARGFFELSGYRGYCLNHPAQKVLRDLSAFQFFGGTIELQKIAIFGGLQAQLMERLKKDKSQVAGDSKNARTTRNAA